MLTLSNKMLRKGTSFLRLCYNKHLRVTYYSTVLQNTENRPKENIVSEKKAIESQIKNRLLFSSYLESKHESYGQRQNFISEYYREKEQLYALKMKRLKKPIPLSLQYYSDDYKIHQDQESDRESSFESDEFAKPDEVFHLPYDENRNIGKSWMTDYHNFNDAKIIDQEIRSSNSETAYKSNAENSHTEKMKSRYKNYSAGNKLNNKDANECLDENWTFNYGEADADMAVTKIPCGGCGALLHCKDTSLPGFLPKEIFTGLSRQAFKETICQRCHFLKEYNVALNINVSPAEYPKILSKIKLKPGLVILMVDLLDFPCSIWPGITEIIGDKRPVVIVGNKVDLLPRDTPGYLNQISECLTNSIISSSLCKTNIKYVSLISAKTGYGVETLINELHKLWEFKGDVYLIGCTNVGKSTLFNALLQSDFCKVEAVDLLQRATVSQWPGTTLNLLKFPILKPAAWRIALRTERLIADANLATAEAELNRCRTRKNKMPVLLGHIGRTFVNPKQYVNIEGDPFSYQMNSGFRQSSKPLGIDEAHKTYKESRWCFDTPGVLHPDQILSILTVEEIMLTLPKNTIKPRTFFMNINTTLFVAGIGRIDFIESDEPVLLTVFASLHLPITVCNTVDANEIYNKLLGTKYFVVPFGGEKRLANWPGLTKGEEKISISGIGNKTACCDIILSSAGWVSITANIDQECIIDVWTPGARGIHVRTPSLIQHSVNAKGPRIKGTPAYHIGKRFSF